MARLSTCKKCGKKLQPEEKCTHASKTYCEECYQKILRESDEYKQLIEFICVNYEIERPTGFMFKQIKDMKTDFGWSYAAMTYTLWYCKEILGKQLNEKYGVALVKHFYEEASDYYMQQEQIRNQMEKLKDVEIKTKIVKQNNKSHINQNSSLVNLKNLLEGGDAH